MDSAKPMGSASPTNSAPEEELPSPTGESFEQIICAVLLEKELDINHEPGADGPQLARFTVFENELCGSSRLVQGFGQKPSC